MNNRLQALYFVRHGESQDNTAYIWSRRDTPLTDKGRAQALEAAKNIKNQGLKFDLIVTSTMSRAVETARIIAREIGYAAEKIEANRLFDERDWGSLTGTSGREFYDRRQNLGRHR